MAVLITGGARSGKSKFAEKLAMHRGNAGIYFATAQIYDEEMRERIELHQEQRQQEGFPWTTREEPYDLSAQLGLLEKAERVEQMESVRRQQGARLPIQESEENAGPVVLVDCLTLWLSNWLLRLEDQQDASIKVMDRIKELVNVVSTYKGHLILVTNEVGSGIVPEYPLGRSFRDLAGTMNQKLAEVCEQVFLVTAGIPIELKERAYKLD
jgi:adenosylcobinamide kinase/adenosylcobinamide-phosphate guanylyltransferase